jgi:hypothetical protein
MMMGRGPTMSEQQKKAILYQFERIRSYGMWMKSA